MKKKQIKPTARPTILPTVKPTTKPTVAPTIEPTTRPTVVPTIKPTVEPTTEPVVPTAVPTTEPIPSQNSKNEEEVLALKQIIKEQKELGSTVSEDLDSKEYIWDEGRLIALYWDCKNDEKPLPSDADRRSVDADFYSSPLYKRYLSCQN